MIRYREYWPAFFDIAREPIEGEVATLDELLEIPFIKERTSSGINYAVSLHETHGHLMRDHGDDKWWVALTFFYDAMPSPTEKLPLWVAPERKLSTPIPPIEFSDVVVPLDDLFASGAVKKTVR